MRIGLVSDTHGLVDPRLAGLFRGCAQVLHAGDCVSLEILQALGAVAPVVAVRGNNDHGPSFAHLPEVAVLPLGPVRALLVHDLGPRSRPKPPARAVLLRDRPELVIHGHSHKPGAEVLDGVLFVNPGSAGPRRFSLPRSAAILSLRGRHAAVTFYDLSGVEARPQGPPLEAAL